MNTKNLIKSCLLPALLISGGCYSEYTVTSPKLSQCEYAEGCGDVSGTVFIKNRGWYLFHSIPLGCGNDDRRDGEAPFVLFENRCTDERAMSCFNRCVAKAGAKAVGVSLINNESVTIRVPGVSVPLVLPYVICTRTVQISGTLVKDNKQKGVSR